MTDRLAGELVRFRSSMKVPAVGSALVCRKSAPELAVIGVRRRDAPALADIDDQWHIGSCCKMMTAVLYGRLVELEQAAWGVPVTGLFPDLSGRIHPGWADRTVEDLFRCRSGMKANLSIGQMRSAWNSTRPLHEQRTDAVLSVLSKAPGRRDRFVYSNLSYMTIGAAIDRLAGMPFEQALTAYVFEPLDMHSPGFGAPAAICGHHARLQLGPLLVFRGRVAEPDNLKSDNPAVMSAAGTLHLTLGDWARFQRIFLREDALVLQPATVAKLLSTPVQPETAMAMGWVRADRIDGVSFFMQGSNTMWSASAMLNDAQDRISLVTCNDARSSVMAQSANLAIRLLTLW